MTRYFPPRSSGTSWLLSLSDTVQIGPGTWVCEGRAASAKNVYVCVSVGGCVKGK